MTRNSTTATTPTREDGAATDLHLAHLASPPDLEALTIKDTVRTRFLGADCRLRIIGSSHYVAVPALGVHELCSCKPLAECAPRADGTAARRIPLRPGTDRRVTTRLDDLTVRTVVQGRPLAAFPADESFDASHRFGERAYTAIALEERSYETYHTYPEYDLALYTRSEFER